MSAKSFVKNLLLAIAPRTATAVFSARGRAYSQKLFKEYGFCALNQKLIAEIGSKVVSGPFQGMTLTPMTFQEQIGPFLLGTYEEELHPWWDALLRHSFTQIIDVGAKFGYYAIGLSLQFPRAAVVSFDTDRWARRATQEMAAANGVKNISIRGFCDAAWLNKNMRGNSFLISDCEGYEESLFSDEVVPALKKTILLIELHDFLTGGGSSRMLERFAATHTIERLASQDGHTLPRVKLKSLTEEETRAVSTELRVAQEWVLLVPKGQTL